jgi:hypothetical protein
MGYAQTSERREKRLLREQMRSMGLGYRDIAARMRAELEGVRRSMRPWKSQPPGKALEEVLAGIRTA